MSDVQLTRDEKNRLIEKACGYVPCDAWVPFNSQSMMRGKCEHEKCYPATLPTNYFKSLDAAHEMEKALTPGHYERLYISRLQKVLGFSEDEGMLDKRQVFEIATATAEQRCEAFGLTMGLWI